MIFKRYIYSEPFLMEDAVNTAHYYQWKKHLKTNRGELVKVSGQKKWGITVAAGEYPGIPYTNAVFFIKD